MVKFHQTFAEIYCLILPIFFLRETSFPKSIYKVPAKDADTHSEPRRTTKMELFGEIFNLTVEYFPNFFLYIMIFLLSSCYLYIRCKLTFKKIHYSDYYQEQNRKAFLYRTSRIMQRRLVRSFNEYSIIQDWLVVCFWSL